MIAIIAIAHATGVSEYTSRDPSKAYYLFDFSDQTGATTSSHPDAMGGNYTLELRGDARWDLDNGGVYIQTPHDCRRNASTGLYSDQDATPYLDRISDTLGMSFEFTVIMGLSNDENEEVNDGAPALIAGFVTDRDLVWEFPLHNISLFEDYHLETPVGMYQGRQMGRSFWWPEAYQYYPEFIDYYSNEIFENGTDETTNPSLVFEFPSGPWQDGNSGAAPTHISISRGEVPIREQQDVDHTKPQHYVLTIETISNTFYYPESLVCVYRNGVLLECAESTTLGVGHSNNTAQFVENLPVFSEHRLVMGNEYVSGRPIFEGTILLAAWYPKALNASEVATLASEPFLLTSGTSGNGSTATGGSSIGEYSEEDTAGRAESTDASGSTYLAASVSVAILTIAVIGLVRMNSKTSNAVNPDV